MTIFEKARRGLPLDDVTVIDVHAHFGSLIQTYIPFNTADEIADNMDRIGIDVTCFCTQPYGAYGDVSIWNRRLADAVKNHPNRMKGYVTLNGNRHEEALSEYDAGNEAGLTLGIKMHTLRQDFRVTDDFLYPVYEKMNNRCQWYLHHDFGTPDELEQLLRDFPNITFIQGHPHMLYERLIREYPNMYICTCAGIHFRTTEDLVDAFGADKILVGSDSVIFDPTFGIGPVAFADISEENKRKILGENAKKLMEKIKEA
ncbi:MAG: amidohydrolase family protein [Clostridia bacterium]|nr:amidohydrolase family protein [Clostridia bacterium]